MDKTQKRTVKRIERRNKETPNKYGGLIPTEGSGGIMERGHHCSLFFFFTSKQTDPELHHSLVLRLKVTIGLEVCKQYIDWFLQLFYT